MGTELAVPSKRVSPLLSVIVLHTNIHIMYRVFFHLDPLNVLSVFRKIKYVERLNLKFLSINWNPPKSSKCFSISKNMGKS